MAATPAPPSGSGYVIPTTGPVTPEEIYYLLLAKGASTIQAIGIMANMKAESSLDPESGGIDSNGKWAGGLISWNSGSYPNAHALVTGDPQADVRAQINYLFSNTNGIRAGLQGATAQQVAGNFAANVEVCNGCNPGSTIPNGWTTRVGYAAGLLSAATSGNWQSAGSSTVSSSSSSSSSPASGCLVQFPGIAGIGATCLLSNSQARAIAGGLTLIPATGFIIVGAVVLAAFAFRRSGAGGAVGGAAEATGGVLAAIPGLEGAGLAVAAAGSAEKRSARRRTQQQGQAREARQGQAREAREGRQYDEVMSRKRDSARGPASREPAPF
jgi:Phage tail lysozyme